MDKFKLYTTILDCLTKPEVQELIKKEDYRKVSLKLSDELVAKQVIYD